MSSNLSKSKILLLWKYWDTAEKKIKEKVDWLKMVIDTFTQKEKAAPIGCRECFLRKIAILIVSGQIKVKEITKSPPLKDFWLHVTNNRKIIKKKTKSHGSDWHSKTMDKIENHFLLLGYQVDREPDLNHGRADLGVYRKGKKDLLIEVGTISFFKLWRNLETMSNFIYLIVPNDSKLIEFRK